MGRKAFPEKIKIKASYVNSIIVQQYDQSRKKINDATINIISPDDQFCLHLTYHDSFRMGDAYFGGEIIDKAGRLIWRSKADIRNLFIDPWLSDSSGLFLSYCNKENKIVFVETWSGKETEVKITESDLLWLNLVPSSFNGVILSFSPDYRNESWHNHVIVKYDPMFYFILEDRIKDLGKKISIHDSAYGNLVFIVDHRKIRLFDIGKEETAFSLEIGDNDYTNEKEINTAKHFAEKPGNEFIEHVSTTALTTPVDEYQYWQTVIFNEKENCYYLGRRKNISWNAGELYSNDEWTCIRIEEIN